MKIIYFLLLALTPGFAAQSVLLDLKQEDSAVVFLDRIDVNGGRAASILPASQNAGQVNVEYSNPDPKLWTQVRWVLRFEFAKVPTIINQATLYLWCNEIIGKPNVQPFIEMIDSTGRISELDRNSKPILLERKEIPFITQESIADIDVSSFVREALKQHLQFVTFRISAISEKTDPCKGAQSYYFGTSTNVWSWKKWQSPVLEITCP